MHLDNDPEDSRKIFVRPETVDEAQLLRDVMLGWRPAWKKVSFSEQLLQLEEVSSETTDFPNLRLTKRKLRWIGSNLIQRNRDYLYAGDNKEARLARKMAAAISGQLYPSTRKKRQVGAG